MKDRYTFTYASAVDCKQVQVVFDKDDDCSWIPILQEFAGFLSTIYGYDVSEKIDVTRKKYNGEAETNKLMESF